MTLEQLQIQINELQQELIQLKATSNIPAEFQSLTLTAEPGYVFKRTHDGLVMGNSISLGYDYSLGFKRLDKEIFYKQVLAEDGELDSPSHNNDSQEGEL